MVFIIHWKFKCPLEMLILGINYFHLTRNRFPFIIVSSRICKFFPKTSFILLFMTTSSRTVKFLSLATILNQHWYDEQIFYWCESYIMVTLENFRSLINVINGNVCCQSLIIQSTSYVPIKFLIIQMKIPFQLEQKMCTNVVLFLCKSTTHADKVFRFNWNEIPHEYEIYFWSQ